MEVFTEYAATILSVLLVALAAVGVYAGYVFSVKYLKSKLSLEQFGLLEQIVDAVVRGLEQSGLQIPYTGEQKKMMATQLIKKLAADFSIPLNDTLLDALIEAAVQILNSEAGKFLPEDESE